MKYDDEIEAFATGLLAQAQEARMLSATRQAPQDWKRSVASRGKNRYEKGGGYLEVQGDGIPIVWRCQVQGTAVMAIPNINASSCGMGSAKGWSPYQDALRELGIEPVEIGQLPEPVMPYLPSQAWAFSMRGDWQSTSVEERMGYRSKVMAWRVEKLAPLLSE